MYPNRIERELVRILIAAVKNFERGLAPFDILVECPVTLSEIKTKLGWHSWEIGRNIWLVSPFPKKDRNGRDDETGRQDLGTRGQ